MKKFILKSFLLLVGVYFLPVIFFMTICPQYTTGYGGSVPDKIKRLESLASPKIIVCGNSNVVFGIQSKILEDSFDMPVVNLGYHAGIGNALNERLSIFNIKKGDIVVLSQLTYNDNDGIDDPELILLTVENRLHLWKIFRLKDYKRLVLPFIRYTYKCFLRFLRHEDREPKLPNAWYRSSFNEYGDMAFKRTEPNKDIKLNDFHPGVGQICINRINSFSDYCKSKGATLVIAAPPFCDKCSTREEIAMFWNELKTKAKCPVVSDCDDYFYNEKYFYDSNAHLTDEGARLRTEQLAKDLKKFLENR